MNVAKLKLVDSESGVIDRALEIAEKRRAILLSLKQARMVDNKTEVYRLIDELVPDSAIEDSKRNESRPTIGRVSKFSG